MTGLDPVLLHPGRLAICSALMDVEEASFRALAKTTGATDSLLSRNVTGLKDAGYVSVSKDYHRQGGRTWVALTDTGRAAMNDLIATLTTSSGLKEED